MKKAKVISSGPLHRAIDMGPLDEVGQYTMIHPRTGKELHKLFIKDLTDATGTEISFQCLAPNTDLPYFHIHLKNEETYVILKGEGKFQVDGECFPVREGSVVRVAPSAARGLANTGDCTMIYMVIQSREGSLEEYSSADGRVVEVEKKW